MLPLRSLFFIALACTSTAQDDPALPRLQREIARLAQVSGGIVGVNAIHIESGREVSLNPTDRFPMASTFKVPIAVQLLSLVDDGKERLDRMVTIEPRDFHPGSGTLSDLFNKGGLALSVRNLMELMLLISDNSATDVVLRLAGGPEAVNAKMRSIGVTGLRVDRPTALLIADASGIREKLPAEAEWTPRMWSSLSRGQSRDARDKARALFNEDPRDTSTPAAMAQLLVLIHRKQLHKQATAELLLDIMRRCRTGQSRLQGLLPAGTVIAHKTGTIANSANDVGIVTLPDNAGHVALAVFVKKSDRESTQMDRGIAEIARAIHDYFLFHPKGGVDPERVAARIAAALKPQPGERYFLRPDPGYFATLLAPLRARLNAVGASETKTLDEAQIYVWLPLRPGGPGVPAAEREALKLWTDRGGPRRQLHFHWGEGSVFPDGIYGEHPESYNALYESALDVDYAALAATQDRVITQLRSGLVRVRTAAGTDIQFRTGSRPFNKQDGDASAARANTAKMRIDRDIELPAGVVRVAPVETSVNGVMVIPEARLGTELARQIRLTFRRGELIQVAAGENLAAVEQYLKSGGAAARRFREFAIGLNPKLQPRDGWRALPYYGYGRGVVRLSLGDNEELGGEVRGGFVRWFFFPHAAVTVDGKAVTME